ncbi:hypothetical protein BgiMline_032824, partial [Biomphalaria glabrata]
KSILQFRSLRSRNNTSCLTNHENGQLVCPSRVGTLWSGMIRTWIGFGLATLD